MDIRRIIRKVIANWPLILISVFLAIGVSYLINRYTPKVYSVNASILIKDKEIGGNAADLLYGSQLLNVNKNLNNESIILRSYPLVYSVVESLNFDKAFYAEGNVMSSEAYSDAPAEIIVDSTSSYFPIGSSFKLEFLDSNRFTFMVDGDENTEGDAVEKITANFAQPIDYKGFKFKLLPKNIKPNQRNYTFRLRSLETITNSYKVRLIIRPVSRDATILNLSIDGSVPEKEVDFLEKLIEVYISNGLDDKNSNATRTIEFINTQLTAISDSLFFIEKEMEQFKGKTLSPDISKEGERIINEMQKVAGDQTQINTQLDYYEYLGDYIKSGSSDDLVIPASFGIQDPILNGLISSLVEAQSIRKRLVEDGNTQNQYLNVLTKEIENTKSGILESVKNLNAVATLSKNDIDSRVASLERELTLLPKAEREFINIKRVYDLAERLYLFLMEKRAEAAIAKAATTSDIKLIDPPKYSMYPISPKTERNFFVSIFLGLLLPIGFILLKDFFNERVRSREDIEGLTDIPFLGAVGHKVKDSNLVVMEQPKSAVAESFRSIRSNLHFFTPDKEKRVFLLTSSISAEGKTFCCINLGLVFSLSEKRAILIGADLRKPKIFTDFGLKNEVGLSSYLANTATLEEVVQHTTINNFDIISGGPIPPNPSELLMSDKMKILIERLKEKYSYIIIDTPPIGLVTDAFILMKLSDHNLFVVRQNYTPRSTIREVQDMFVKGKLSNISMLFNDVKLQNYGYGYGYSYGYGYGYGNGYYEDERPNGSFLNNLANRIKIKK